MRRIFLEDKYVILCNLTSKSEIYILYVTEGVSIYATIKTWNACQMGIGMGPSIGFGSLGVPSGRLHIYRHWDWAVA